MSCFVSLFGRSEDSVEEEHGELGPLRYIIENGRLEAFRGTRLVGGIVRELLDQLLAALFGYVDALPCLDSSDCAHHLIHRVPRG